MPTDAAFPVEFDSSGDIATVSGEEFYHHHALQLGLIATSGERGGSLTQTDIRSMESRIEAIMESSPYFAAPVTASVQDVTTETVTLSVSVPELNDFTIEL